MWKNNLQNSFSHFCVENLRKKKCNFSKLEAAENTSEKIRSQH